MARSLQNPDDSRDPGAERPPAISPRKILLIHGVGEPLEPEKWSKPWEEKLDMKFGQYYPKLGKVDFAAVSYHDLFDADFREDDLDPLELSRALATLGWSGMQHGMGGLLRGTRGVSAEVEMLRWTAGMVVRWVTDPSLRALLRERVREGIEKHQPSIIAAHSLGSLIAYDLFREDPGTVKNRTFISFGSQIGNAFVRNAFNGRLSGLPTARYWLHLFNPNDGVFTAEIRLHGADTLHETDANHTEDAGAESRRNFYQILTPFDNPDPLDHTAVSTGAGTVGYLDTFEALQLAWPRAFGYGKRHENIRRTIRRAVHKATESPDHRALLIGIDRYSREDIPPLAGCTADTFLVSQILQEAGFPTQNIRMLHNDRATAAAIRDRLDWLLDDVDPGEFRLLFFSGHGHQMESYGPNETVERLDECLCPYDFNYSLDTAILDDHLYNLYAQLPYDSQLVVILDCCHSGGMARSGSSRIRGLTSPMDVAHRGLVWHRDQETGNRLWLRRAMSPKTLVEDDRRQELDEERKDFLVNAHLPSSARTKGEKSDYVGQDGTTRRLFRALSLRQDIGPAREQDRESVRSGDKGPYMPVILQACEENDVALEHTDGMITHGAFTFSLARVFRSSRPLDPEDPFMIHWSQLVEATGKQLKDLGYTQKPQLLVPAKQDEIKFNPPHPRKP